MDPCPLSDTEKLLVEIKASALSVFWLTDRQIANLPVLLAFESLEGRYTGWEGGGVSW